MTPFLFYGGGGGVKWVGKKSNWWKVLVWGMTTSRYHSFNIQMIQFFFFKNKVKCFISLKTILRCFELVFDLKVNFSKSSLMGLNMDQMGVLTCASPLNCITMNLPFTYFGMSVGVDARKMTTWQPIFEKMKRKLAPWWKRHLSFGGRICLVKSVLSSLPLYFLSFSSSHESVCCVQ